MKLVFARALCTLMALLIGIQPALVAAHDFGGSSYPGNQPGSANTGNEGGGGPAGPQAANNHSGGSIYLYDGSEYFSDTDIAVKGVFGLKFKRHYNSRATYDSALGYGWDFSYNERLFTYADGSAIIRWSTGFKKRFVQSGGGYVSTDSRPGTLIQNPDGSFTYTSLKGNKREFDQNGVLVRIEDIHGNNLRLTYTVDKKALNGLSPYVPEPATPQIVSFDYQLLRVEEWYANNTSAGRYLEFTHNPTTGRMTSLTDHTGRVVNYSYDIIGNLIRVDYPENLFKTYDYADPYDPHNITSFNRGYSSNTPVTLFNNTYDDQDRVITQAHAGGLLTFEYSIPLTKTTQTKTVKDGNGNTLYEFTEAVEFGSEGHVVKFTDGKGNIFEYIRDTQGNPTREIVWKNEGILAAPQLVEERIINRIYNGDNNLHSVTITLDSGETITTTYTYDHGWRKTRQTASSFTPGIVHSDEYDFEYNGIYPKNIIQKKTLVANTGTPLYETVDFSYNDSGQLTTITYANGDQRTYNYTNGYLTNADGITFERDSRGNITALIDLNMNQTTFQFDALDRIVRVTNPLNEHTILTYSGFDVTHVENGQTGAESGLITLIEYDDWGRAISSSTDLDGIPVNQITLALDSEGNVLSLTDALAHQISFSYDFTNRIQTVTDPGGNTVTYSYTTTGLNEQITDAGGNTTSYSYDDLGRLWKTTGPDGDETTYKYNALNLLTKLVNGRGQTAAYTYDLAGKLIKKIDALGQTAAHHYDLRGRLDYTIDVAGQRVDYSYNSRNFLEQITIEGTPTRTLDYIYDNSGNITDVIDSVYGQDPLYTYTYDVIYRPKTVTLNTIDKTLYYDYTNTGRRQQLTVKSGLTEEFSFIYDYDSANRLASIQELPENKSTSFTYDNGSRLTGRTYSNSATATISYQNNGLIGAIQYQKADMSEIDHLQYETDTRGNYSSITNSVGISNYTYDKSGQLISANYPVSQGLNNELYSYDSVGNRLSSAEVADWIYDGNDRLKSYNGHDLSYGPRGNLTSDTVAGQTTSYDYDALNRMTTATVSGQVSNYFYDHFNRRIKKESGGNSTWYLYDDNTLLAEYDQTGSLTTRYCHSPVGNDLISMTNSTGHHTALTNHLGSPLYLLDQNQITWKAAYQAFGIAVIDEDPDGDGSSVTCNLRLPGQYYDDESGLHYNIARFYDPQIGRYLQADPVGGDIYQPLSLNRYTYSNNNPLMFIDPDGRVITLAGAGLVFGMLILVLGANSLRAGLQKFADSIFYPTARNIREVIKYITSSSENRYNPNYEDIDISSAGEGILDVMWANFPPVVGDAIRYVTENGSNTLDWLSDRNDYYSEYLFEGQFDRDTSAAIRDIRSGLGDAWVATEGTRTWLSTQASNVGSYLSNQASNLVSYLSNWWFSGSKPNTSANPTTDSK